MSPKPRDLGLLLLVVAAAILVWLLVDLRARSADSPALSRAQLRETSESPSEHLVDEVSAPVSTSGTSSATQLPDIQTPLLPVLDDPAEQPTARDEKRFITSKPVVVWGMLRDAKQERVNLPSGDPWPTRVFVEGETASNRFASFLADSQYGIDGVAPGDWTLRAIVDGYFPWSTDVVLLPTDRRRRVDIELEAYPRVRVRIEIDGPKLEPDGGNIRRILMDAGTGMMVPIRPVVTKDPPPELLPNVNRESLGDFDVRMGEKRSPFLDRVLEIHCRLPVHVSAAVGDRILRTVRVRPGDDEVVLVVTKQELDERLGVLRFKVTDEEGRPPPAPVVCTLWRDAEFSDDAFLPPSNTGEILLERMLPGPLGIEIKVPGFAYRQIEIRLEPGAVKDLGEIRLQPETSIRGRVVGPDGRLARARVECIPLSESTRTPSFFALDRYRAETARGTFMFSNLARGRYVLRATNEPGYSLVNSPLEVSTEAGSIDGIEIHLQHTTHVEVRLRPDPPGRCVVFFEGADDLPVDERGPSNDGTLGLSLPPGRYRARAVAAGEVVATAEFHAVGRWMRVIMKPR